MLLRLFKHRDEAEDGEPKKLGPHLLHEGDLFAGWFITYRLAEEMQRARRYGRPLALMMVEPLMLPGERPSAGALAAAAGAARLVARSTDLIGWLDGGRILTVMPETVHDDALVAVTRWRDEMWMRGRQTGGMKWRITAIERVADFESAERCIEAVNADLALKEAA